VLVARMKAEMAAWHSATGNAQVGCPQYGSFLSPAARAEALGPLRLSYLAPQVRVLRHDIIAVLLRAHVPRGGRSGDLLAVLVSARQEANPLAQQALREGGGKRVRPYGRLHGLYDGWDHA
jgi:hypothetical protein